VFPAHTYGVPRQLLAALTILLAALVFPVLVEVFEPEPVLGLDALGLDVLGFSAVSFLFVFDVPPPDGRLVVLPEAVFPLV